MRIIVNKLGSIQSASLDLEKQLMLFCGYNSTGKTYLSYIIYAILSQNYSYLFRSISSGDDGLKTSEDGSLVLKLHADTLYRLKTHLLEFIYSNLDELFGMPDEDVKKMFSSLEIKLDTTLEDCRKKILQWSFEEHFKINHYDPVLAVKKENTDEVVISSEGEKTIQNVYRNYIFPSFFYRRLIMWPISSVQIFPVERNSIYTFSKELSITRNALIDQMQRLSRKSDIDPFLILENGSKRYPKAISDGIMMANDLSNLKKSPGPFYGLACDLEQRLLKGSLSVGQEGDVEFLVGDKKRRRHLPIHMSASLIKTMASFFFYLKYKARVNDLAIIDEPEMNMHPDIQVIFVRFIVRLMKEGLRFLISTHSDYIVRELNYYIMKEEVEGGGVDKSNVVAYFFKPSKNGKVSVRVLPIDRTGIQVPSIDAVIEDQNERCSLLIERLLDSDE